MQGLGKQKVGYFRKISQMASKFGFFVSHEPQKIRRRDFQSLFSSRSETNKLCFKCQDNHQRCPLQITLSNFFLRFQKKKTPRETSSRGVGK
jgi:hypothetical protein